MKRTVETVEMRQFKATGWETDEDKLLAFHLNVVSDASENNVAATF